MVRLPRAFYNYSGQWSVCAMQHSLLSTVCCLLRVWQQKEQQLPGEVPDGNKYASTIWQRAAKFKRSATRVLKAKQAARH